LLGSPNPLTSTFALGVACGLGLACLAIWVWRKRRASAALPSLAKDAGTQLPPDVDVELRRRSSAFARSTGHPASAPFVYSAMRDNVVARRGRRRARVDDEGLSG
jgi:hypothetical protein